MEAELEKQQQRAAGAPSAAPWCLRAPGPASLCVGTVLAATLGRGRAGGAGQGGLHRGWQDGALEARLGLCEPQGCSYNSLLRCFGGGCRGCCCTPGPGHVLPCAAAAARCRGTGLTCTSLLPSRCATSTSITFGQGGDRAHPWPRPVPWLLLRQNKGTAGGWRELQCRCCLDTSTRNAPGTELSVLCLLLSCCGGCCSSSSFKSQGRAPAASTDSFGASAPSFATPDTS